MLRHFRAVILGAPGSGKGTISSRIIRKFDIQHIASGDILRQKIIENSDVGKNIKQFVESGQLVPEEIMVNLILGELDKAKGNNWLLDGFPRTKSQASLLAETTTIDVALNLIVPFDVIVDRIKGRWIHPASGRVYNTSFNPPKVPGIDDLTGDPLVQRADDNPEAVLKRLQVYTETIGPVIEFYRAQGLLENFSGRTSDEIWPVVFKYLSSHISAAKEDARTM